MENLDTKTLICETVRQLIIQKSVDEITVTLISKECNINRQTFYYYFKDKFGVIEAIFLKDVKDKVPSPWTFSLLEFSNEVFFNAILENKIFYKKLFQYDGQNSFEDILFNFQMKHWSKWIPYNYKCSIKDEKLFQYIITYITKGGISILKKWVLDDMKEEPEYIMEITNMFFETTFYPLIKKCT